MDEKIASVRMQPDLALSFVPAALRRKYAGFPLRDRDLTEDESPATLLWIDIRNFSPLCNRLMKNVDTGVEQITDILNHHYDCVLNTIHRHGGEPLFFVGDGLMAAWFSDQYPPEEAIALAAACAFEILEEETVCDDRGDHLSKHAVIAYGECRLVEFEGVMGNRLYNFYGNAFSAIVAASKNVVPDRLLISNTALRYLGNEIKNIELEHDTSMLVEKPVTCLPPERPDVELTPAATKKLQSFLQQTLVFPLDAERLKWIAERRPVTVLFVRISHSAEKADINLKQLRESVALATPLVRKYDGLLNQVWMEEKQSNILICFGPPPSAHMDNPERCVSLALALQALLRKAGFANSMGLSTGTTYCGIIGNDILRQYTVIGDVVNLSARMAGAGSDHIFCDKNTFAACNKTVRFKPPVTQMLKGFADPIFLYEPEMVLPPTATKTIRQVSIGREAELAVLVDACQKAIAGQGSTVVVTGENGVGKTKLLEDFRGQSQAGAHRMFSAYGEAINRHTPYAIWTGIFSALFQLEDLSTLYHNAQLQAQLEARYGTKAGLLNAVLPIRLAESDEVKSLSERQRVVATHDFLLQVLKDESEKQALVIVMDDAHLVDEHSWQLLTAVSASLNHCLLVLSFLKSDDSAGVLSSLSNLRKIDLEELPDVAIEKLICAKLNTDSVEREVSQLVIRVAKGNPFFCIELIQSLLDQQWLRMEEGRCRFDASANLSLLSIPETVRGAVRRRIDQLDRGSRLTLKVASVVGNRFGGKVVDAIYPIKAERDWVPAYLTTAAKAGFLKSQVVDHMNGYLFSNATTFEVAYEMTLAEQRKFLHRETALWYETYFQHNLPPFYVRLAHHFLHAGEITKAVAYYEKEAIRLFRLGFVKQALAVGLEGVRLLGQEVDRDPALIGPAIMTHVGFISTYMQGRQIPALLHHKPLQNENTEKLVELLLELCPFAHQCQEAELFALMAILSLRRTLEEGNGPLAAEVYAMYAIIHKSLTGDTAGSMAWSQLAMNLDRQNGETRKARVSFIHCWFIAHWLVPHKDLVPVAGRGADAGFASGDITFACFCLSLEVVLMVTAGMPLQEIVQKAEAYQTRNNYMVLNARFHLLHEVQVAKALQGRTKSFTSLSDADRNEEEEIANICNTELYNQIGYYFISKQKLHAHFGNWKEAIAWGEKAVPVLPAFVHQPGQIDLVQFTVLAALYAAAEEDSEESHLYQEKADTGLKSMQDWTETCPQNFAHKLWLLIGIKRGLLGDMQAAEPLLQKAASAAKATGYWHDQGLAFEHLARIQVEAGLPYEVAAKAAVAAYKKWGAFGKVTYLQKLFNV
ncbi:AAA family ATPase [Flavisolibacter sp. BT320]|nr:AAA family ATPase [Flavisolibacter longurius]